ncbi:MAG: peptidoglycan-binding domain-containing protein [Patescibacteria group bacterium]
MKKNISLVLLLFVLFTFAGQTKAAEIDSCSMGYKYSNLTGMPCAAYPSVSNIVVSGYDESCIDLTQDITYKDRDKNANGPVYFLQKFLKSKKYLSGKNDGVFGPMTLRAVKSFQKSNNLEISGLADLKTRLRIRRLSCDQPIPDLSEYQAVLANYDYTLIPGYKYDQLPSERYTKKSWAEYQEVIKSNLVTEDNTQDEVDQASNNLKIGQSKLVRKGNLNSYNGVLLAYTESSSCRLTEESWNAYKEFIAQNKVTEEDSQDRIDAVVEGLGNMQKLLKRKTGITVCPI